MILGTRLVLLRVLCAGLVSACAAEVEFGQHGGSRDAGVEAGALDAASRLPEAAPVMRIPPSLDAAARDSEPTCPRATAARAHDAETTTNVDIQTPGAAGEAGAPPEDCLAPCVWEL